MMRPAIALQDEGEAFYFIADYHALTSVRDPAVLRENSRGVALDFLACGFDPERGTLFLQSDVPQVTELRWILSTVTPMGLLERAHSYKDKLARGLQASAGLFTYPVLHGRRYFDLRQRSRAGRQRPETTYRNHARPRGKDQRDLRRSLQAAGAAHSRRDRDRSRHRRPEDEQELRQHDRHFRRRKGNAETRHEHRDRLKAGRSAERSR